MSSINALGQLLDKAFTKIDRNQDNNLDSGEFRSFYEVLRPGLVDENNNANVSVNDMFQKMDHNDDGLVSRNEMATTTVAIPAVITPDESLDLMIKYLQEQGTASASLTAKYLSEADPGDAAKTQGV